MSFHPPQSIAKSAIEVGVRKTNIPISSLLILGFLAGAFIALGFLLDIRVIGDLPEEWGSLSNLLGALVFPVGLILVILAGGELVTGNMLTVSMAFYAKRISFNRVVYNWFWVIVGNFAGAIFVAYMFGHVVGITETGPYLNTTVAIAQSKLDDSFLQAFVSAIGCNWLVSLAVWITFSTDSVTGKILGIWFPIMGFVAIGFQHVVANMFIIPAAIFAGYFSWFDYIQNFVPVFLGNVVGGAVFVGLAYFLAFQNQLKSNENEDNHTAHVQKSA